MDAHSICAPPQSMVEDFVCIGRRDVLYYAAFSEGGLRPLVADAVEPAEDD